MRVTCPNCRAAYDDEVCWTFCPHARFTSPEDAARQALALDLMQRGVAFRAPNGEMGTVAGVRRDGFVMLRTVSGMSYRDEDWLDPLTLRELVQ